MYPALQPQFALLFLLGSKIHYTKDFLTKTHRTKSYTVFKEQRKRQRERGGGGTTAAAATSLGQRWKTKESGWKWKISLPKQTWEGVGGIVS